MMLRRICIKKEKASRPPNNNGKIQADDHRDQHNEWTITPDTVTGCLTIRGGIT